MIENLSDFKELCFKTTHGPWSVCDRHKSIHGRGGCLGGVTVCKTPFDKNPSDIYDFIFITHAKEAVPILIEEIERLYTVEKELKKRCADLEKKLKV